MELWKKKTFAFEREMVPFCFFCVNFIYLPTNWAWYLATTMSCHDHWGETKNPLKDNLQRGCCQRPQNCNGAKTSGVLRTGVGIVNRELMLLSTKVSNNFIVSLFYQCRVWNFLVLSIRQWLIKCVSWWSQLTWRWQYCEGCRFQDKGGFVGSYWEYQSFLTIIFF